MVQKPAMHTSPAGSVQQSAELSQASFSAEQVST